MTIEHPAADRETTWVEAERRVMRDLYDARDRYVQMVQAGTAPAEARAAITTGSESTPGLYWDGRRLVAWDSVDLSAFGGEADYVVGDHTYPDSYVDVPVGTVEVDASGRLIRVDELGRRVPDAELDA